MNPNFKKRSSKTNKDQWYWGINNNTNTHCYLLEMVLEAINIESMKSYSDFIRNNITGLCLEVGNMSDFFEQLNYIVLSKNDKNVKIKYIMDLRDQDGNRFISEPMAVLIFNTMTMKYIKNNIKPRKKIRHNSIQSQICFNRFLFQTTN